MNDYLFLAAPVLNFPVIFVSAFLMLVGYFLGRLIRLKFIEAAGCGFLLLCSLSNLAVFGFQANGMSLTYFPGAVFLSLLFFLIGFRFLIPLQDIRRSLPGWWKKYLWMVVPSLVVYLGKTSLSEPRAQTSFAQAWRTLYAEASVKAGHLIDVAQTQIGPGFINSSSLYAPNTLGLTVFVKTLFPFIDAFHIYVATALSAVLLVIWTLARVLGDYPRAIQIFAFTLTCYLIAHPVISPFMSSNMSDEILMLCGALVASFALKGYSPAQQACGIILVASVMAFGRNYGVFYGFVLCCSAGVYYLWRDRAAAIKPLIILASIFVLFSLREVYFVLAAESIFFPRVNMLSAYPFSLEKFLFGTASDWGIFKAHKLSPTALYTLIVGAFVYAFYKDARLRNLQSGWIIFSPFILLLLPLSVEIMTQYRKLYLYNKIYMIGVWFIAWYPVYLYAKSPEVFAFLHERKIRWRIARRSVDAYRVMHCAILAIVIIMPLVVLVSGKKQVINFVKERFVTQRFSLDAAMAESLRQRYSLEQLAALIKRPVIYVHLEPGIGLRYSLGGDLFQDYDFFGECIQGIIKKSSDFESFVRKTNGALIYLSNGTDFYYYNYLSYNRDNNIVKSLSSYENIGYLDAVKAGKGVLLIPKLDILGIKTPEQRVCNPQG